MHFFQTHEHTVVMGEGSDGHICNQRINNEGKLEVVINKDQEDCKVFPTSDSSQESECQALSQDSESIIVQDATAVVSAEMHEKVTVRVKFNWIWS